MAMTYFKRFRMEIDLIGWRDPAPEMPPGYAAHRWDESLVEAHAEVKFQSFRYEIDANVFPCLGDRDGCLRLMNEIARRDGFLDSATWLLEYRRFGEPNGTFCGTIQGIEDAYGLGSIQNIGVTPGHRGRGLGSILLANALRGFRAAGLRKAFLEVTAQNIGAIRLYQRVGFRKVRTVYKAAEVVYA
ncbi:MAG: GNAT family N-acetyltransferase [Planctomycetes bacterium]|nr:GNAT family N-acetyltransferase [Planctomycetota bacterium]